MTPATLTGLPESSVGATNMTDRIQTLWNGSWIAALAVGVIVWGLIAWCVVGYRRRKGDPELPAQVRYNMPIEIFYTIVPVMMVGVLFYYTARDQAAILKTDPHPDVTIQVVGKKWSWDFNYLGPDGKPYVYDTGRQVDLTGKSDVETQIPTLYLPVNESVRFDLYSRDVNHSFWVPAFLFKMDLIAGEPNHFGVTPTKEGTFAGKCGNVPEAEQPTRVAPATKGFRIARPRADAASAPADGPAAATTTSASPAPRARSARYSSTPPGRSRNRPSPSSAYCRSHTRSSR